MDWRPSDDEINEYAQYLSVNLDQHPQLRPLMIEGLTAPLPEGWKIEEKDDDVLYISPSGVKQQDHPYDDVIRKKVQKTTQSQPVQQSTQKPKSIIKTEIQKNQNQLLDEPQLVSIYKNILPTEDDIKQLAKHFKILSLTDQIKNILIEFCTQKLEDWQVYKYKNTIFFQKDNISTWKHPLEEKYAKKILAAQVIQTMKQTPPATTEINKQLLRDSKSSSQLETIQEDQNEPVSVIQTDNQKQLDIKNLSISKCLSIDDLEQEALNEKQKLKNKLQNEISNLKKEHAQLLQHEISLHLQNYENCKLTHSQNLERLQQENHNEIEVLQVKHNQALKFEKEQFENNISDMKNKYSLELHQIMGEIEVQRVSLNRLTEQKNELSCEIEKEKNEIAKEMNLLQELRVKIPGLRQQQLEYKQDIESVDVPFHLKNIFASVESRIKTEKQILQVQKSKIDAQIVEYNVCYNNKDQISNQIQKFRIDQFKTLKKQELFLLLKSGVQRKMDSPKDSFSDFLREHEDPKIKALDDIVQEVLQEKLLSQPQQNQSYNSCEQNIVHTPLRTPQIIDHQDWLNQFRKHLQ